MPRKILSAFSARVQMFRQMSEAQFQRQVIALATAFGWLVYHTYDSKRCVPGFPDLVLVKAGEPVIFAELKTMRGQPRPDQKIWLAILAQCPGVQVYLWRPCDIDQIEVLLKGPPPARQPAA